MVDTFTSNPYGVRALPLARHPTSCACSASFGVCVAANLQCQAWRLAIVVLSELEPVARGGLDQMFATPLEQA